MIDLHADNLAFQQRDGQGEQWQPGRPACRRGSSVYLAICLDMPRSLAAVLRRYRLDGEGRGFDRTVVPWHRISSPQVALASRAQARRLGSRLQRLRRVELASPARPSWALVLPTNCCGCFSTSIPRSTWYR